MRIFASIAAISVIAALPHPVLAAGNGNLVDTFSNVFHDISSVATGSSSGGGPQQISALPGIHTEGEVRIQVHAVNPNALQFEVRNPTTRPLTLSIAYDTYDRFGNVLETSQLTLGPIDPMATGIGGTFVFQNLAKVAQFKLIRRSGQVWPDSCRLNGASISPCPLSLIFVGAPFPVVTGG